MRLRFSILAIIVAATYAIAAGALAISESGDCMGWCMGLATFPEVFLLDALPAKFFYSPIWTGFLMHVFAFGVIGVNAFILYVIFGGVKWWPDNL